MSDPFEGQIPEDIFKDVPLFRELQRVLFGSSGPINWELARQMAIATAVGEGTDPEPTDEDRAMLEGAVRAAELAIAELSGLEPPPQVTKVEPVRRARWVEANIEGLKDLFEPGAERLASAMAEMEAPGELEERAAGFEAVAGMGMVLQRMAPLLAGAQLGLVLGMLGRGVLGQYELPVPRAGDRGLLFVVPNLDAFEHAWDLPRDELRAWVALHETTHAFELGQPWVRDYFLAQVRELAEGMTFDLSGLEERLASFDPSDPEGLQEAFGDPSALLGQELTDDQRLLMRRIQALMASAEGYADHVMGTLGERMLAEHARIEEARTRQREGRGEQQRTIERMLGFELKEEQYRLGRAFCERVAAETDERTLARMWESAESLPSMPELEEPTLWLSRMA